MERVEHKLRHPDNAPDLSCCTVCNAAEGELPTDCPGRFMTPGERQAVLEDEADFIDGRWVSNPDSQDE